MKLYHYTLGFPKGFCSNVGTVGLSYSRHAMESAANDRYGIIKLPSRIDTGSAVCIELGIEDGQVVKLVYRCHYAASLDLCIVCYVDGRRFRVATVWLNSKMDQHDTLRTEKYCRAG